MNTTTETTTRSFAAKIINNPASYTRWMKAIAKMAPQYGCKSLVWPLSRAMQDALSAEAPGGVNWHELAGFLLED